MKFIWEPDDLYPGRQVIQKAHNQSWLMMVVANNSLGGAARFGLVNINSGLVFCEHMGTTELSNYMNDRGIWVPTTLRLEPKEDDDHD